MSRHAVEHRARAALDPWTPEIDHGARLGRRRLAGQLLAHEKPERIGQRRLGTVGDFGEAAPLVALLHARGEIGGNALHALGADRLDAGLLDRLEHRARLAASRRQGLMQGRIVTGDGSAAASAWPRITAISVLDGMRDGSGSRAVLPDKPGRLAREHHLDRAVGGDRAGGLRHGALEGIERRLFTPRRRHRQLKATLAVDCGRSSPKQR